MKTFNKGHEWPRLTSTNRSVQSDGNTKASAGETLLSNENVKNVKTKYG